MNKEIHKARYNKLIYPLYHIIKQGASDDYLMDWIGLNGPNYSNFQIKHTLKTAGREDFIKMIIPEEDIDINDTIKSRMTSRIGKVIGVHADGDTIEVKWDEGGRQFLSKESVYKISTKDITNPSDLTKVKTTSEPYADMLKEDKTISPDVREQEKLANDTDLNLDGIKTEYNLLTKAIMSINDVDRLLIDARMDDRVRYQVESKLKEAKQYIQSFLNYE